MKRYAWLLLLFSALVQPLNKAGIYMLFQANRQYIAATLCENRYQPESSCQGTCYLKKELEKETENEKRRNKHERHLVDLVLFIEVREASAVPVVPDEIRRYAAYKARVYERQGQQYFHPPQLPC